MSQLLELEAGVAHLDVLGQFILPSDLLMEHCRWDWFRVRACGWEVVHVLKSVLTQLVGRKPWPVGLLIELHGPLLLVMSGRHSLERGQRLRPLVPDGVV